LRRKGDELDGQAKDQSCESRALARYARLAAVALFALALAIGANGVILSISSSEMLRTHAAYDTYRSAAINESLPHPCLEQDRADEAEGEDPRPLGNFLTGGQRSQNLPSTAQALINSLRPN
jgi:hypothetical protein